jgi:hypothetical protein
MQQVGALLLTSALVGMARANCPGNMELINQKCYFIGEHWLGQKVNGLKKTTATCKMEKFE